MAEQAIIKEQQAKAEKEAEKKRAKRAKQTAKARAVAEANRVYWRLGPNGLEQISK